MLISRFFLVFSSNSLQVMYYTFVVREQIIGFNAQTTMIVVDSRARACVSVCVRAYVRVCVYVYEWDEFEHL